MYFGVTASCRHDVPLTSGSTESQTAVCSHSSIRISRDPSNELFLERPPRFVWPVLIAIHVGVTIGERQAGRENVTLVTGAKFHSFLVNMDEDLHHKRHAVTVITLVRRVWNLAASNLCDTGSGR